jgi:hypothetical protein
MAVQNGKFNWYRTEDDVKKRAAVYDRFLTGFSFLARTLPSVFPGCEVVNVTNASRLECFRKELVEAHFSTAPISEVPCGV